MDYKWKYKINLKTELIFDEIEEEHNLIFPEELKNFIIEHNAATPHPNIVKIGENELIFGAVLSFNKDDMVANITAAYEAIERNDVIPFGIDPFGNLFCYRVKDGLVLYWDHEEDRYIQSVKFGEFINSFYEE